MVGLTLAVCQMSPKQLSGPHHVNRTWGESNMEKLMSGDITKEITYQLLSQTKQTHHGENEFITH